MPSRRRRTSESRASRLISSRSSSMNSSLCCRRSRTRTTEEQDIAVSVLELESTQAVIGILERFGERDLTRREFFGQRVRIGDVEIGVPAGDALVDVS